MNWAGCDPSALSHLRAGHAAGATGSGRKGHWPHSMWLSLTEHKTPFCPRSFMASEWVQRGYGKKGWRLPASRTDLSVFCKGTWSGTQPTEKEREEWWSGQCSRQQNSDFRGSEEEELGVMEWLRIQLQGRWELCSFHVYSLINRRPSLPDTDRLLCTPLGIRHMRNLMSSLGFRAPRTAAQNIGRNRVPSTVQCQAAQLYATVLHGLHSQHGFCFALCTTRPL